MATTDAEQLRLSGFKRILLRLDDDTRRKYCCRAVEEDLHHVKKQVRSCVASMTEVKQVHDATRKLHASQQTAVSSELLTDLETLQVKLEMAINKGCGAPSSSLAVANKEASSKRVAKPKQEAEARGDDPVKVQNKEAKSLVKKIQRMQDLKTAVDSIQKVQQLMPVLTKTADVGLIKTWKRRVTEVGHHAVTLVTEKDNDHQVVQRLEKTLNKMVGKCPGLQAWKADVKKQLIARMKARGAPAEKSKKKQAIVLPHDGEAAMASGAPSAVQLTTKSSNKEKKKGQSAKKARAQLQRCSREVRALRDKFDLGAYDVNLSRMVTIVDSLWSGIEHSEVVLLTTALFTLVETVEKVADHTKRRDRLVCLESVLAVVSGSSELQLTTRRKTIVDEYANNCRQSLDQLNREGKTRATSSTSEHAVVPGASLAKKYC
ncbi:unnamed protein product [Hyaloperonospora brassicae]|uniref:TFIIS N-terminal domain-containing protein n=1 Tax=Hyaloperonospora brassicae TaxID=162125 RepID=A0AAV0UBT0_HYABA|nr:unnamed protein product [Hyaloperonospora brassicae]